MKNACLIVAIVVMAGSLSAQNVGIGTLLPKARLHVADSSVVFTAAYNLPFTPGPTPVSGPDSRVMWYVDKAAFRAGVVKPDEIYGDGNYFWDGPNVGYYWLLA